MSRVGVTNRTPARTSKPTEENVVKLSNDFKKVTNLLKDYIETAKKMQNDLNKYIQRTNITNKTPNELKAWNKFVKDYEKMINKHKKEIINVKKVRNEINRKGQIATRGAKINKNTLKKIAKNFNIKY
jgi:DNA repair ATPase RecN